MYTPWTFLFVPDDETCLSDTGKVINPISRANIVKSLYSEIYSGDFTNMITVLHHIAFQPAASQFF
jgi:hypothetical protein